MEQMVIDKDPDAVPFFKASKLAGARATKGGHGGTGGIRAKPKPFQ